MCGGLLKLAGSSRHGELDRTLPRATFCRLSETTTHLQDSMLLQIMLSMCFVNCKVYLLLKWDFNGILLLKRLLWRSQYFLKE